MEHVQSAFVFVVTLSILILVHEWGHFITAKRLGVRVERFALGFGPTIYSKIYNGTRYMINIIPLGGYVKLAGDDRLECKGGTDEFFARSIRDRALIVVNGPIVNFILAYVCLFIVFMVGYPDFSTKVGTVLPGYPAQTAGIEVNDKITRINGQPVASWSQLQEVISTSQGPTIQVQLQRIDKEIELVIIPRMETVKTIFGNQQQIRRIGIGQTEDLVSLRYGPGVALVRAGQELVKITTLTYKSLVAMVIGAMSVKENMTGPIGIFFIIQKAAQMGWSHVIFIMGVISASLAIFNLLPIIPLDGGHLFLFALEKIRGRALSVRVDEYIAKAGFSFIILLGLFVIYNDCERLGWLDKIKQLFS